MTSHSRGAGGSAEGVERSEAFSWPTSVTGNAWSVMPAAPIVETLVPVLLEKPHAVVIQFEDGASLTAEALLARAEQFAAYVSKRVPRGTPLIAGKVRSDGRGSFVEGAAKVRVNGSLPDGSAGVVMVRPERLRLEAAGAVSATAEQNAVEVTVLNEMYLGSSRRLGVRLPDGTTGLVREPASTASAVRAGDRAVLRWPVNDGVLLVADPAAEAVSASPAFQEGHVAPGRSAG